MNFKYQLIFKREALKYLSKQSYDIQDKIASGIKGLQSTPPTGDIKRMKGNPLFYRLRIGSYRIIFRIDHVKKVIFIEAIATRGDIYK